MSDAYVRTGRGGAGNFHPQPESDEVKRVETTTTIAPTTTNTTEPPSSPSAAGVYMRSGRGGAGNFVPPTSPSHPSEIEDPSSSQSAPLKGRYASGRGGAGNWVAEAHEESGVKAAQTEQDRKRQEALDAGIAREIRASLPLPPRTYHLHAPGRGRRPEDEVVDC